MERTIFIKDTMGSRICQQKFSVFKRKSGCKAGVKGEMETVFF
jgi:hypothetical protein